MIAPHFADALSFREGLALVRADDKTWGYIDKTGKMLIQLPCSGDMWMPYDAMHQDFWSFSEGLVPVRRAK